MDVHTYLNELSISKIKTEHDVLNEDLAKIQQKLKPEIKTFKESYKKRAMKLLFESETLSRVEKFVELREKIKVLQASEGAIKSGRAKITNILNKYMTKAGK